MNKYLLAKGFRGVSLWPFVVLRHKDAARDLVFLNHERIHLKQQQELLVLPFYLLYSAEFVLKLLIYRNARKAYFNISFEREAYANERNFEYCQNRKLWGFARYFRKKKFS